MRVDTTFTEPFAGGRSAAGREADGEDRAGVLDPVFWDPAGELAPWPAVLSAPSCDEHPAASIRAPLASRATAPRRTPAPALSRAVLSRAVLSCAVFSRARRPLP
ncbi:hypothetical protein [Streptomyces sp. AC154]|uniref:hypothetical protein n=1 Tax=Streptomyces sp. AC154 TaxID=3143184 RepID=UPI003F81B770